MTRDFLAIFSKKSQFFPKNHQKIALKIGPIFWAIFSEKSFS
jgi:hypothetical protein